jgi:hypothetical protein
MTTDVFSASLARIDGALTRLDRRALLDAMREGLPIESVRSSLGAEGLASSLEIELLYGWRNGTSTVGVDAVDDVHLFPGFYFLTLQDALANYRAFRSNPRWEPAWLPIFANGGGDFYVLDSNLAGGGQIRHFRIESYEHPVEFGSLSALANTLGEAFERGVFFVDSDGYLEMDDLLFGRLAAELNPDIEWWRE